jgi:hypothetical protein
MKKMLVAAASLIVGAMLCVSAASAAPSGGSSLQLVVLGQASVAGTAASSTQARYGNQVTFNIKTSASQPWVSVACYQNGLAVYGQYWGFWSGYSVDAITNAMAVGGVFTLGPTALWSSGAASCTAKLSTFSKTGKESVLSTLPFTVAA